MIPSVARRIFQCQERLLGRRSFAMLTELQRTERWPREQVESLQLQRLQQIIATAHAESPFWREIMDRHGIEPASVQSLADLQQFPLLDKETVRSERERMVTRRTDHGFKLVRTSGSTNEALQFYTNAHREAQINAARMRGHEWIGIRRGDREMYFWGSPVELNKQDRIKRVRDWLINDGLTNGFELNPPLVRQYFEYWLKWRPKCIFGYPNSLNLMVAMARPQGIDLSRLKQLGLTVICTTSEMLTDPDRKNISQAFGVPVFDSYGLREAGLVGHECQHGTMHTMDEQLILETIDPHTLASTDGEGELVVTNIVSPVMPMIRYRTGDMVTPVPYSLPLRFEAEARQGQRRPRRRLRHHPRRAVDPRLCIHLYLPIGKRDRQVPGATGTPWRTPRTARHRRGISIRRYGSGRAPGARPAAQR